MRIHAGDARGGKPEQPECLRVRLGALMSAFECARVERNHIILLRENTPIEPMRGVNAKPV